LIGKKKVARYWEMSKNNHIVEVLPEYLLGCLDDDEEMQVAAHLADCATCRAEQHKLAETVADLALLAPAQTPPSALKGRLMARIGGNATPMPMSRPAAERRPLLQRWLPVWGAVSLLLVLTLGALSLMLWQRLGRLEQAVAPGDMEAIPLAGSGIAPEASGYILVSSDGQRGAVVVDGLEPLAPEQEYQLWLIRDGQRTSGATFVVGEDGYGWARIRAPESLFVFSAADVTVEPAGGSPSPSGDPVLAGPLIRP
jgi:anti-sigma-K factor RskA